VGNRRQPEPRPQRATQRALGLAASRTPRPAEWPDSLPPRRKGKRPPSMLAPLTKDGRGFRDWQWIARHASCNCERSGAPGWMTPVPGEMSTRGHLFPQPEPGHQNGAADAPLSRGSRRSPLFGSLPLTGGNETAPTEELPRPVPVSDPVGSPALGPALTPAPETLPPSGRVAGRVSSRVLPPVSGPVTIRVAPPWAPK